MIYSVSHVTQIRYDALVSHARYNLRLKPADWPGQRLIDYHLAIDPAPARIETEYGPYVVNVTRMVISEPVVELRIESRFRVEIGTVWPRLATEPTIAELRRLAIEESDISNVGPAPYLFASRIAPMVDDIARWAAPQLADNRNALEAALEMACRIRSEFDYDPEATEADTPVSTAFKRRHGVCQDFAHVMIVALRSAGLPAAYVSGYLRTIAPPGKEKLVGADATHAWVALWCGRDLGWRGFDPTNGCIAGEDHIFTAMGRDYADVTPIDGTFMGNDGQELEVAVDVIPEGAV